MTEQELSEIKKRVQAATKEPWKSYIEGRDHESGDSFIMTGIQEGQDIWNETRGKDIYLSGATADDLDFIAHARQDIPLLLDYIQELQNELKRIKNNI
jgi:hypothetical protein